MHGVTFSPPYNILESVPVHPGEVVYFTEVLLTGELCLPNPKPDIEFVINVTHEIYLNKFTVIPVKLDHCTLDGCKFLLRGFIRLAIEYSAQCPEQTVHLVHATLPFETLIIGESGKTIPLKDCNIEDFIILGHIEHLAQQIITSRTIDTDLVLLLWLKRKNECQADYSTRHTDNNECDFEECSHQDCTVPYCNLPSINKQITINEKITLPHNLPSICEILGDSVDISFKKVALINTPLVIGPCHLPLKKVIVKGHAEITIKYLTDKASQDIHAFTYSLDIASLLEWPGGPSVNSPLCVEATKEYFSAEKLSTRNIFNFLILKIIISRK